MRLFCFAYAGGRATIFGQWDARTPAEVDVCPIEFPGRGRRDNEPLCHDMDAVVAAMLASIGDRLDAPFACFGHSMGALVAFEVARRVRALRGVEPVALYLSARRAPHLGLSETPWFALPRPKFFAALRRLDPPKPLFDNPRISAIAEPVVRADCEVVQTYRFTPDEPLRCPIVAFGGEEDRYCPRAEIEPWRSYTTSTFMLHMVSGGHFFIESSRGQLLSLLSADLRERLAALAAL